MPLGADKLPGHPHALGDAAVRFPAEPGEKLRCPFRGGSAGNAEFHTLGPDCRYGYAHAHRYVGIGLPAESGQQSLRPIYRCLVHACIGSVAFFDRDPGDVHTFANITIGQGRQCESGGDGEQAAVHGGSISKCHRSCQNNISDGPWCRMILCGRLRGHRHR